MKPVKTWPTWAIYTGATLILAALFGTGVIWWYIARHVPWWVCGGLAAGWMLGASASTVIKAARKRRASR